jgi:hypothetical protein
MPARRSPPPWSVAEQGVSNKRQMWPPGQQQRATGPAIRQRFTDLRLPKGHHDEPPEPDWFRPLPNNYKFGNGDEQNDGF